MSRNIEPLRSYHQQELMNELNETFCAVKVWLYNIESVKHAHKKPSLQELDSLQARLNQVLKKDSELMRK